MATKPAATTRKTAKPKRPTQRDVLFAMADFIVALGPLTSQADAARQTVLESARSIGWKG